MTSAWFHRPPALGTRARLRRESASSRMTSSNPDPMPGTSSTSTPPPVPVAVSAQTILNEPSLTPSPFHGNGTENAQDWLDYFKRYVTFKQLNANASLALFALLMRGTANTWYSSLSNTERENYDGVLERFATKYAPAPISLWRRASELWSRDQKSGETVEEYYSDMVRRAREVSASNEMTRFALVRGLRPELRTYVMQQNPATNDEFLAAAKVAEATVIESSPTITTEILDAIRRLEACAATSIRESRRSPVRNASPSPRPRSASASRPERRVRFDDDRREFRQDRATNAATFNDRRGQPFEGPDYSTTPPTPPSPRRRDQPGHQPYVHRRIDLRPPQPTSTFNGNRGIAGCTNCGRMHAWGTCPAVGKFCRNCGKRNHFALCCRSRQQNE